MKQKSKSGSILKSGRFINDTILNYFLFTLFAIFLLLFTSSKLTLEDDYFWHFATGRYIVQNGQIPSVDVFSFSTKGQPWIVTEWLWDVLSYTVLAHAGYGGVSLLTTIVFFIISIVFVRTLRKFKISYSLIFLFLLLLLFGAFERITPRPHLISFLFLILLLSALIRYKYFERKGKAVYYLPLMFLFWANMHMGCVIGIFIFGLFIVTEAIAYSKPPKFPDKERTPLSKKELATITVVFGVSIITMLVNPHGIMTYLYAASSQVNMKMLQQAVREWISPFDPETIGQFQTVIYIIVLILGLSVLYYSYKKKDIFAAVLYTIFAYNSTRAIRFTVDYLIVISLYLVISVAYLIGRFKNVKVKNYILTGPAVKLFLSLILLFFIYTIPNDTLYHSYLQYARFFGFGIDKSYYPEAMFQFIKDNKIDQLGERPLWNFPGKTDFFDSRDLNDNIMNDYQTIYSKLPGYEKKIQDYNFDFAICVVPDILPEPQLMGLNVISYFCTHTNEWKLVFWNDRSLLFVRNEPKFADVISKHEYKYISPYNYYYRRSIIDNAIKNDRSEVITELNRKHFEDPNCIFLNIITRGIVNQLKGL
jgi:hypothetical protein